MPNTHHYTERAIYLRRLARDALTESLRRSCLKEAEEYESLVRDAEQAEADDQDQTIRIGSALGFRGPPAP
jgi:hypothetical protein